MISDSRDISFFHQDALGSVMALTNKAGVLVEHYGYCIPEMR